MAYHIPHSRTPRHSAFTAHLRQGPSSRCLEIVSGVLETSGPPISTVHASILTDGPGARAGCLPLATVTLCHRPLPVSGVPAAVRVALVLPLGVERPWFQYFMLNETSTILKTERYFDTDIGNITVKVRNNDKTVHNI